jgi:hypothetical protein
MEQQPSQSRNDKRDRARGESRDRSDTSGIQGVRRQAVNEHYKINSERPPAVSMVTVAETVNITQEFHF